jgi:hypothetical protein
MRRSTILVLATILLISLSGCFWGGPDRGYGGHDHDMHHDEHHDEHHDDEHR